MGTSPVETVKDKFGGRAKLVEQLVGMVDRMNGDQSAEQTKSRLMGLSNAKLVRLYKAEQTVRERFGDRAKLVAHILSERKKAGLTVDDSYQAKLAGYTKARLLDLTKQNLPARDEKRTPEQRLASKRGRKARARAMAKIKK
jgi:hypothetical protein